MSTEIMENYETLKLIEDEMKFLTKSEIRLNILNCLNKSPYSIKELVKNTGITYSSVSSNISKLEKKGYILKERNKFSITPLSQIYLENIIDFNKTIKIIQNFEKFWNKHDINYINKNALTNLTDLYKSELVESTSTDIYKTHNTVKKHLIESNNVKAIFPYLHPDYPQILEKLLDNQSKTEIITNNDIYNGLILNIDKTKRRRAIQNKRFKIHSLKETINLYLTVCDNCMSLGLFKNDGSFDQNRILIANNKKAIKC